MVKSLKPDTPITPVIVGWKWVCGYYHKIKAYKISVHVSESLEHN